MSIRFFSIRAFAPAACLVSLLAMTAWPSFAQQTPPASQQPAVQTPVPVTNAPPPVSKEPDYPDPRGISIGLFGLSPITSSGPDIRGGKAATTFESLYGIGQPYRIVPEGEFAVPVTRTGMVYAEFERYHGDATQVLNQGNLGPNPGTFVNSINYNSGDTVQTTYHIITGRIYLDDLLYPHKFPVARLRFHSIWGIRYVDISQTATSPTEDNASGAPGSSFGVGTGYIFLPEFGLGVEYALAKHVLFKAQGAGFAIPHHSDLYDADAHIAVRQKNLEILFGVKMLHFKTSPQKEEYTLGSFVTPFVGLRWHF